MHRERISEVKKKRKALKGKPMPTPWDIDVTTEPWDDGHVQIRMRCQLEPWLDANPDAIGPSYAETRDGARWVAGILARVVLTHAEELRDVAAAHRCPPRPYERCGVEGEYLEGPCDMALDPEGPFPSAGVVVPAAAVDYWIDKLTTTLAIVLESEQRQVTARDELDWQGEIAHEPVAAPEALPRRAEVSR